MASGKRRYFTVACLILSCLCKTLSAQVIPVTTDSSRFYRSIESFSKKRKITRFVYGLFLKPVPSLSKNEIKILKKLPLKSDRGYEGKVIRNIHITTLDPFEYSEKDSAVLPLGFLYKGIKGGN